MGKKVLLINMPFAPLSPPQLGIAILQSVLQHNNISCDTRYFTIDYAKRIGLPNYENIVNGAIDYEYLVGEWIFSLALWGDTKLCEKYLSDILFRKVFSQNGKKNSRKDIIEEFSQLIEYEAFNSLSFIQECYETVNWADYSLVGFSSTFQQNVASLALAQIVKKNHPKLKIVFGGANCEDVMGYELISQFKFIDIIVNGEAEEIITPLANQVFNKKSLRDIFGVVYRKDQEGIYPKKIKSNWYHLTPDIGKIPLPNFEDYFRQLKLSKLKIENLQLPLETSRGCWWGEKSQCIFCGLNGKIIEYRKKRSDLAIEEIDKLNQQYNVTKFHAVDCIMDKGYFDSFLNDIAKRNNGYNFFYETKSNLAKSDVEKLSKAGVVFFQPGIESLDTETLKFMRKGVSGSINIQLLKWCKTYSLHPNWNYLINFGNEKDSTFNKISEIIPKISHLTPPLNVSSIRLSRFSPMFIYPEQFGLMNVKHRPEYEYIYKFSSDVLQNLAYNFSYELNSLVSPKTILYFKNEIEKWRKVYKESSLIVFPLDSTSWLVIDSRPIASQPKTILSENDVSILKYCDEAKTISEVQGYLSTVLKMSQLQVAEILDELLVSTFLLKFENKYISLPIFTNKLNFLAKKKLLKRDAVGL
ncbi:MAG: RiPP maturation radical SAM C-methyltransferase [Candidatus Caldatribacteriota bacterium]|nr:RiPP maturation radical SAM C-methyltransferase [Candidatus Caldatribacteriota bacterium]